MSLIMPAFSSPELKAFPLHLRHYRSSGSAPSLPNLPSAGKGRFFVATVVLPSLCICQWRKYPYLPYQPLSVRHLPRTNVLASYGICRRFPPLLPQTRKPSPNATGYRSIARFGASAPGPSSPARSYLLGKISILKSVLPDFLATVSETPSRSL